MRAIFLVVFSFFLSTSLSAFERNMMSLYTPSTLEPGMTLVEISHRFVGSVTNDPLGTMLGIDEGANIRLDIRYCLVEKTALYFTRTRNYKEYTFGAQYSLPLESDWAVLAGTHFAYFKESTTYEGNLFYVLGIQAPRLSGVSPLLNIAYDGYDNRFGAGLGLDWQLIEDLSLSMEYYTSNGVLGDTPSLSVALKWDTFGHRFFFLLHNNTQMGVRRLLGGSSSSGWHLGFKIIRILEWG